MYHTMEFTTYYEEGQSRKTLEIGKINLKLRVTRKVKRACKWYFQDRFGLTMNLMGIIMMVI